MGSSVSDDSSACGLEYSDCIANDHSTSGSLIARCYSNGDRIGHSLWWLAEERPQLVMKSLEGTSEQPWPISSPFQQIVCENVGAGGKPVLLGVGMAGKAHWSATIEGDSMTEAIALDIACRSAALPEQLGSAYCIPRSWKTTTTSKHSVLLENQAGLKLIVESIGEASLECRNDQLRIQPSIDATLHQRGQTYRWRYVLRSAAQPAGG